MLVENELSKVFPPHFDGRDATQKLPRASKILRPSKTGIGACGCVLWCLGYRILPNTLICRSCPVLAMCGKVRVWVGPSCPKFALFTLMEEGCHLDASYGFKRSEAV